MTALQPTHPKRVVLFRDSWGYRFVWNRILGIIEVYEPRAQKPYRTEVVRNNTFHGALTQALRKFAKIQLLPNDKDITLVPMK